MFLKLRAEIHKLIVIVGFYLFWVGILAQADSCVDEELKAQAGILLHRAAGVGGIAWWQGGQNRQIPVDGMVLGIRVEPLQRQGGPQLARDLIETIEQMGEMGLATEDDDAMSI